MLTCTLFIDCRGLHLRTFCTQIQQCAKIGGLGGQANFGNAKILMVPILEIPPICIKYMEWSDQLQQKLGACPHKVAS